jgi:acyl-CoA thioester hydrolase
MDGLPVICKQDVRLLGFDGFDRMSKLPVVLNVSVPSEWIDYNNHMGDFAYSIAFSRAGDGLFELFGLDPAYRERSLCTIYTLETRTGFLQECKLGDELFVDCQILDLDPKRVHIFLRMYRAGGSELVACQEALIMHMRRDPGRQPVAEPMPRKMLDGLAAMREEHAKLPVPDEVIRKMGIRRKTVSA